MSRTEKEKREITVDATKCQCCLICVMRCGLRFSKEINPKAAKIEVVPFYGLWPEIHFSPECDRCGICVRYCPSRALSFSGEASGGEEGAANAS